MDSTELDVAGEGPPTVELPPLAQLGATLRGVDTPSLVLDLEAFETNLQLLQQWTQRHGVALRPHGKAHKCPEIALRQIAAGARGICVQKVSEALPFVLAGVRDIHVSNEIVGEPKLRLLAQLARQARISVCVDHPDNAADLSRAASALGVRIEVLVELDIGQGRCGVSSPTAALELARRIESLPGLRFAGLQAYHGSLQHCRAHAERAAASHEAAARTRDCVRFLARHDYHCPIVTGGGTGSVEFDAPAGVYTEMQAGTYAFMDADYASDEWAGGLAFQHSLFLLATVMSTPTADRVIVDVGLKSTTVECGLPKVHGVAGLTYVGANDEHGVVRVAAGTTRPALGDKLLLVPSHCDPTFNLHDTLVALRGGAVEGLWPIAARGLSR